jgi:hypothetical protein
MTRDSRGARAATRRSSLQERAPVRDDGVAIEVCPRCGERESLDGDDPADQIPFTAWPVAVEQLVDEDLRLIELKR